ncbi:hypothetical protein CALVIDRAFT_596949 [Calocera viscosa TUFC12733]|uniref:Uncharacterized protein n=1 Tax=Calocera viscosa (strain TUFC12733) TaxID=1330018 RepID=A0A167P5E1_CALVF|nr:hypothetical protein CALVIDRAFT_596949 [Calocera viscosa TUFC12733]
MQLSPILSLLLSLALLTQALPSRLSTLLPPRLPSRLPPRQSGAGGSNDQAVLQIAQGLTSNYTSTASVLSSLLTSANAPLQPSIHMAVAEMQGVIGNTTALLSALPRAEVGGMKAQVAAAYLVLLDTYMSVMRSGAAVTGFLDAYAGELDDSLTGMVLTVDTAAQGVIAEIAWKGHALKHSLNKLGVFERLNGTVFAGGAV